MCKKLLHLFNHLKERRLGSRERKHLLTGKENGEDPHCFERHIVPKGLWGDKSKNYIDFVVISKLQKTPPESITPY